VAVKRKCLPLLSSVFALVQSAYTYGAVVSVNHNMIFVCCEATCVHIAVGNR